MTSKITMHLWVIHIKIRAVTFRTMECPCDPTLELIEHIKYYFIYEYSNLTIKMHRTRNFNMFIISC